MKERRKKEERTYDKIYGIICDGSTSQRSYMQMLSRIRPIYQQSMQR